MMFKVDWVKVDWELLKNWVMALSFLWGIINALRARRAQRALAEIRRRGDAPYLTANKTHLRHVYRQTDEGEMQIYDAGSPALLSASHTEIPDTAPAGTLILFLYNNIGQPARSVMARLDGKPVKFGVEPEFDDASGATWIEYAFDPAIAGKAQRLEISMEMNSGRHDTHVYEMVHGAHLLHRIDPPTP